MAESDTGKEPPKCTHELAAEEKTLVSRPGGSRYHAVKRHI
ncbi:hypothetical protein SDC9_13961 [bioreactor metagenome]|uniref:Uncharacterized protein n=1 Tax=bioreactor metagenome TaxID=1076179 RepID=A0A644TMV6_9ZZZZ